MDKIDVNNLFVIEYAGTYCGDYYVDELVIVGRENADNKFNHLVTRAIHGGIDEIYLYHANIDLDGVIRHAERHGEEVISSYIKEDCIDPDLDPADEYDDEDNH